ncbi:hypothetical protein EDC01DRAFT_125322 [Geopyxis carbonaria]|nr:hypothetical protein EDC01DRAFT_125322 [Geopyxis carbonaria]
MLHSIKVPPVCIPIPLRRAAVASGAGRAPPDVYRAPRDLTPSHHPCARRRDSRQLGVRRAPCDPGRVLPHSRARHINRAVAVSRLPASRRLLHLPLRRGKQNPRCDAEERDAVDAGGATRRWRALLQALRKTTDSRTESAAIGSPAVGQSVSRCDQWTSASRWAAWSGGSRWRGRAQPTAHRAASIPQQQQQQQRSRPLIEREQVPFVKVQYIRLHHTTLHYTCHPSIAARGELEKTPHLQRSRCFRARTLQVLPAFVRPAGFVQLEITTLHSFSHRLQTDQNRHYQCVCAYASPRTSSLAGQRRNTTRHITSQRPGNPRRAFSVSHLGFWGTLQKGCSSRVVDVQGGRGGAEGGQRGCKEAAQKRCYSM